MSTAVKTTVTELPESRVRVAAEVAADEVERRIERTARELGRNLKLPGFRKGKVPPPLVIQRMGRDAVLDETVREAIGSWYVDAIAAAGIAPVGDPQLALDQLPGEGEALTFTIEIGVRPKAQLGTYQGVEAGRREPSAAEAEIEPELEALRERLARLETVERPAAAGDFAVIDYVGSRDGEAIEGADGRDQLVELGSGRLLPGLEEGLIGMAAGEQKQIEISFPDDYGAEQLAGKTASFAVTLKEVKEKRLPELDDELASDAAGFETLDELRDDIRKRLLELDERRVEAEFREAALDAAVAQAHVEVPDSLIEAQAQELYERMLHALSHQGISEDAYLKLSGKTQQQLRDELRPDAELALRREAVLDAVVEAEGIEPDEAALLEALAPSAERAQTTPAELLEALRKDGRVDSLRRDVAARQAVELIAAAASPISVDQADAREKLWTPDKEADEQGGGAPAAKLWTPGG